MSDPDDWTRTYWTKSNDELRAEIEAEDAEADRERVAGALAEISAPLPVPDGWSAPGPDYAFSSLGTCRSFDCRREIAWYRTPRGKTAPYDRDGTSHFATCPAAEKFRRRRSDSSKT